MQDFHQNLKFFWIKTKINAESITKYSFPHTLYDGNDRFFILISPKMVQNTPKSWDFMSIKICVFLGHILTLKTDM